MTTAQQIVQEDLSYIVNALQNELGRLAGKSLLVTGGAGFLGYYLVQTILHANQAWEDGQRIIVTVYDNYARGIPDWLREMQGDKNLSVVRHDVRSPLPLDAARFHFIIHAAGIASPTYYRAHPIETMDANVGGLRHLLDYCRERQEKGDQVEGLLFFSSSEIYGDPDPANIPTPETYRGNVSCTGPRACYDESKRYGETLCVNFARQYDLPVKVARPFNNYGPGLKITDRRVIPDFAQDIFAGRDIVMISDGSPTRTFCYVADAVIGYLKILLRGRPGEVYNIGVEVPEVSIAELAERMTLIASQLFGYRGRVIRGSSPHADYLADNPNRRCPLIAKARTELGYAPQVTLDEGLRRSLIWYRNNFAGDAA